MNLLQPSFEMAMLPEQRCILRLTEQVQHILGQCVGDVGVVVGLGSKKLPLHAPGLKHLFQAGQAPSPRDLAFVQCSLSHFPFKRCSLDVVVLLMDEELHPELSRLLNQIVGCLSEDGQLFVITQQSSMALWCQIGMPFCRSQGMVLKSAFWGDNRKLSLLNHRIAKHWNDHWQLWLPFMSQWSVQHWQKQTHCRPRPPLVERPTKAAWQPGLVPTSRSIKEIN
ncbi:MAG: hypothetical protein U0998_08630 [Moraxellaceae bacterium]|nr:hypothetical protein [Moraxellaceae bacterium]MDZ4297042.1 hypothetical protein [Moraxellaceae bacterium]MDZ4387259.1 hypothetical protein [Moraxellaceae bacterium]